MTYELCKQLKNAGFPQKDLNRHDLDDPRNSVYEPALEELIDACGDKFTELKIMVGSPFVYGEDETVWWSCPLEDLVNEGKTPKEAVAKLWLEIKKLSTVDK